MRSAIKASATIAISIVLAADPANPDDDALTAGSNDLNAAFNELATFCDW